MKLIAPWLPPVAAALAVIGLVVSIGKWEPGPRPIIPRPVPAAVELCEGYPWRDPNSPDERIMNIVLEDEGAYIDTQRVSYEVFRSFMIKHAKIWRPDYIFISGTQNCRIGRGVEVFDTLRLLQLCPCFAPTPEPAGTRLPAIELYRDGIPLEEWEQMEKDAGAR